MIPILYEAETTDFTNNGIGRLSDCISCTTTEKESGVYECKFKYPMSGIHYSDILENRIIYCIHDDTKTEQPFEIYGKSAPINGIVTFYAHHVSYKLGNVILEPFSATSCAQAMTGLKENEINASDFTFWTDKSTVANFEITKPTATRSILGGTSGSILDVFGGGDYEWDGYTVKLYENRGQDNNVYIRYGVNLLNLTQQTDNSSVFNAVCPFWYKEDEEPILVTLPEKIVRATGTESQILRPITLDLSDNWEEPPTEVQLRNYCISYLQNNKPWNIDENVSVDFIALWQTEDYKNVAPLQRVRLYDYVHIVYDELGINKRMQVVETVYNVLTEKYDRIQLGASEQSFAQVVSGITETEIKREVPTKSFVQKAIDTATATIKGNRGGYKLEITDADGHTMETLYMDAPNVEDAVNILRIGQSGIAFSNHGYDPEYFVSAWTIDGAFNANFITSGILNANIIRAGIITDLQGYNYWNLETGEFRLTWNTSVGNSTLGEGINERTRSILDAANAYGLGWRVNHDRFDRESYGDGYLHGYASDGTAADVNGWVLWNGEKVTIPKGMKPNPNNTMLFDTTTYLVYRTSDQSFHDVQWNPSTKHWVANTYNGGSPSARAVWTWEESTDIILASYSLAASESALYAAQLFTPPKKLSDLAENVQGIVEQQISDFATTINAEIADIQAQLDDEVDTWYFDYAPTISNYPASEWTTEALRAEHQGDMFLDTSTGYAYRFISNNKISQPYGEATHTDHGITFTLNSDGSVTANGTASGNSEFAFKGKVSLFTLPAGTYTINQPVGASGSTWRFKIDGYLNNVYKKSYVSGASTSIIIGASDQFDSLRCVLIVYSGQTVNNLTFKPTIVPQGDDGWIWLPISDSAATQALQIASEARDTADHKRRVFISTPYTPYDQGDIWMQGTDGDILVCLESRTSEETYDLTDWGKLNKYTDEATATIIAEEKVSEIQIGGRNLLYDTNAPTLEPSEYGLRYFSEASSLGENGTIQWLELPDAPVDGLKYGVKSVCTVSGGTRHLVGFYSGVTSDWNPAGRIEFKKGQTYTASVWAKSNVAGALIGATITTASDTDPRIDRLDQTINTADKWTRFTWTFEFTGENGTNRVFYMGFNFNIPATVWLCGFQLEIGNKATDWSEYPKLYTSYGGKNLIRNTNNVDLSTVASRPNINGFYNDGANYGNAEYSAGTVTAVEHGIRAQVTSSTAPFIRFGTATSDGAYVGRASLFGLEKGLDYTYSFDYTCKLYSEYTGTGTPDFGVYLYYWTGSAWSICIGKLICRYYLGEYGSVKSGHATFMFKIPDTVDKIYLIVRPHSTTASYFRSGDYIELRNLKLEKGNKATDWSAAPEDIAADITDVYVKSGGRNYLVGTGKPFERAFLSESGSYEVNHVSGTYQYQTLSDLGFKSDDTATFSFDWEEELINLIPYPYSHTTRTVNGITFTDNGDGTITANGTATAQASFNLHTNNKSTGLSLGVGTYHLTGCPSGGSNTTYQIYANYRDTENHSAGFDRGSGLDITVSDASLTYGFYVQIQSGATVNNLTFTPKLVCTSARGTFRLEGYRTDGTNYTYAANLLTGAGLSGNVVTPTETAMSGHVSSTLAMTSALLNVGDVHIRADGVKGIIRISNLKLEKGEVSTAWTAAPEDASIASPGINIIRGTNTFTTIGTASAWSNGAFRPTNYSAANGTNTPIAISDILIQRISRGVESKCTTAYGGGWGNVVGLVQTNVPNTEKRKAYTISCYAKGNGILQIGIGSSSGIIKRIFLDHVTEWTRYSFNFIVPPSNSFSTAQNRTNSTFAVAGLSTIQICGMKLEEGITATEWNQAPEDVTDSIVEYAESLGEQIDGKAETWYQTSDPSTNWTAEEKTIHTGDLWYNSTSSVQKYYRWTGSAWNEIRSNPPTAVFDVIDGKAQVFISTPTTPYYVGDLWFNSTTSSIMVCKTSRTTGSYSSSDWEKRDKYTDDSALEEFISGTYQIDVADLESQLDKKIETWYQSSDPSSAWTTAELKSRHTGDLWHKTSDNKEYRWSGSAWVEQAAPNEIFTRINKKTSIYYGTTSGTYTDVAVGDYLVDSTNGSTYRWSGSRWIKETDYSTAISTAVTNYDTNLNQQKVFNKLTNNGQTQGVYLQNGRIYINASYVGSGTYKAGYSGNNGVIEVYDANNNRVGRWDNSALYIGNIASNLNNPNFRVYSNGNVEANHLGVKDIYSAGNASFYATDTTNGGIYSNANIFAEKQISGYKLYGTYTYTDYFYERTSGGIYIQSKAICNEGLTASKHSKIEGGLDIWGGLYVLGDIYATGGIGCGGSKPRLVATKDYGERYLYCYETPTPMFGDIGEGLISDDGKCYVEIDNILAQTISTNQYQVFLQKYGEGDCWVSEKTGAYFIVEGTPGLSFGWEIKAKQFDLDQIRLNEKDSNFKPKSTINYAKEFDDHVKSIREERRTV